MGVFLSFPPFMSIMMSYGYLFGFIKLIKDTHRDEVFIERNNVVIMENNHSLYSYDELLAMAVELGLNKVTIIDYGDFE